MAAINLYLVNLKFNLNFHFDSSDHNNKSTNDELNHIHSNNYTIFSGVKRDGQFIPKRRRYSWNRNWSLGPDQCNLYLSFPRLPLAQTPPNHARGTASCKIHLARNPIYPKLAWEGGG